MTAPTSQPAFFSWEGIKPQNDFNDDGVLIEALHNASEAAKADDRLKAAAFGLSALAVSWLDLGRKTLEMVYALAIDLVTKNLENLTTDGTATMARVIYAAKIAFAMIGLFFVGLAAPESIYPNLDFKPAQIEAEKAQQGSWLWRMLTWS